MATEMRFANWRRDCGMGKKNSKAPRLLKFPSLRVSSASSKSRFASSSYLKHKFLRILEVYQTASISNFLKKVLQQCCSASSDDGRIFQAAREHAQYILRNKIFQPCQVSIERALEVGTELMKGSKP